MEYNRIDRFDDQECIQKKLRVFFRGDPRHFSWGVQDLQIGVENVSVIENFMNQKTVAPYSSSLLPRIQKSKNIINRLANFCHLPTEPLSGGVTPAYPSVGAGLVLFLSSTLNFQDMCSVAFATVGYVIVIITIK